MSGFQLPSVDVSDLEEYVPYHIGHGAYIQKVEECLALYGDPAKQASYQKVAHMVREKCQNLLEETGTKGVVTCRTKTYESLKAKLRSMEHHTDFTSWALNNDIFQHHEMGDLAAVRIGVYLPQDVIKMARECQQRFKIAHLFGTVGSGRDATRGDKMSLDIHGRGPWRSKDQYGSDEYWQHSGYRSWQMVINWEGGFRVEIQIGTVVSQAWAEIQHNVIYKRPDNMMSTPTMKRMIDAINGLAMTTEIILSELEQSIETAKQKAQLRRITEEQYNR
ncbi:uncharacterized protein FFB20_08725 [Fusarium fujikuroi]|uniref:RelA/SpoT domain-containing protein n=1 Tax=Fusarium fujikuroi TaxID=5127 RepID=A0A2H3RC93_FUSFU|nr:uncharacterized protein Y057_317 [Fusarium fujikuroi]KLP13608.1 uncharacterized protein LW94_5217 [Fusarium fujikuroi]QGI59529.1 hypothetical protein CEK27_001654 [Fusarium fujikuroi]QGI76731.1 hypothetical protein CEK25_001637 [Fusarium fujikuroi]QGI90439.1 hypothetical protein CEK26_001654 [Fusarium fujikuroi]